MRHTIVWVVVLALTAIAAFAQGAKPRTQATDTAFVVEVPTAAGPHQVHIAGFSLGLNLSCVLVSEAGSVAVVPGACPRR